MTEQIFTGNLFQSLRLSPQLQIYTVGPMCACLYFGLLSVKLCNGVKNWNFPQKDD